MVALVRWSLLVGVVLAVGCRTAQVPRAGGPASFVRTPKDALARAKSTTDPVAAAEIAWVSGNDRAYARKRLDARLATEPGDAEALLRRGLLNLIDLNLDAARKDLVGAVAAEPWSADAGAALVTLHSWRARFSAQASPLVKDLRATGIADPIRPADPFHRALAVALLLELGDAGDDLTSTGGWFTTARVVGPMAPAHERILAEDFALEDAVDWRNRDSFGGVVPPVRTVRASGIRLPIPSGGRRGTYLAQLFFRMESSEEVLLQVRMPEFGRIKIDGFTVLERDPARASVPGLSARRVRLGPGWHRMTALVTASGRDTLSISLLDEDGQTVTAEIQPQPPQAPLVIGAPKLGPVLVAAYRQGHPYWLADPNQNDPERDLFGRLLAASAALSGWVDDLDTARAYLYGLGKTAPNSSSVQSTLARLAARSRLPNNILQGFLRKATALDPTNAGLLVALGRQTRQQDPTRALELAERAAAIAPKAFGPFELLYSIHRSREWHPEAVETLQRAAERGAGPRLLFDGATYLRNIGRIDAAEKMEALGIERTTTNKRSRMARRAARRGDLSKAIQLSQANTVDTHVQRAEWSLALGKHDEAIQAAKAALQNDPLSARATRMLAIAYAAKGRLQVARSTMDGLRARGQTSPQQEALIETWGGPPVAGPSPTSWLGQSLKFDPLPLIAPLEGTTQPRGLDASDRWAGHSRVQVLDRLIERVLPNGSAITLRHGIVRLQTKEATDSAGEINLPPDALPLRLRTLKPDGSTVDVDQHEGKDDLSFSALAPGDGVEQKWVSVDSPATPWGGYVRRFFFKSTSPIVRSEFAVIVPKGHKVEYFAYHGAPTPTIREQNDHVIYYWRAENVAPVVPEPRSPHPTEFVPFVVVTVDIERETALEARTQRLRTMSRSSYDVVRIARAIVKNAATPKARVESIFRWLAGNISHGPRGTPAQVLARARGDRTGLLVAMLNAVNVDAQIVPARSGQAPVVAPSYPNTSDFQSMLVRIEYEEPPPADAPKDEKKQVRVLWADMDRQSPWLGLLPPWFRGGHYLTRSADGQPSIRPIRDRELASWPLNSRLRLAVDDRGNAVGELQIKLVGMYAGDLSRVLSQARPEDRQRQVQRWLASLMPSARLKGLSITPRRSPLAPAVVTASVAVPGFMIVDNGHLVAERFFSDPLVGDFLGQPGLKAYLRTARRSTPLLVSPTFEISTVEVTFSADVGAPVEGPKSYVRTADFGRFEQRFTWDPKKRRAVLERQRVMPLRRVQPEAFAAFRDNAQGILQVTQNRLILPLQKKKTARANTSGAAAAGASR